MLNLIQTLLQALAGAAGPAGVSRCDPHDPFAHPAIARMSPTELADLPFPRARPASEARPPRAAPRREAA